VADEDETGVEKSLFHKKEKPQKSHLFWGTDFIN